MSGEERLIETKKTKTCGNKKCTKNTEACVRKKL